MIHVSENIESDYYEDQDFDSFLGIGKKAKARKKERKARKSRKRALRSKRKGLKVERRQLKNDQRRAKTETIRTSNKINETMVASHGNQPLVSKSPFNSDKAHNSNGNQIPSHQVNNLQETKDYTIEIAAAGLVILLIVGAVIYKNKHKQR